MPLHIQLPTRNRTQNERPSMKVTMERRWWAALLFAVVVVAILWLCESRSLIHGRNLED